MRKQTQITQIRQTPHKIFQIIWLSNLSILSVPDESFFQKHVGCTKLDIYIFIIYIYIYFITYTNDIFSYLWQCM